MVGSYRDIRLAENDRAGCGYLFLTRSFPREEVYGLVGQLRRAAVSVPSNIAEGKGRRTDKEFLLFFTMPGIRLEVETQLTIAGLLGYIETEVRLGNSRVKWPEC